MAFGFEKEDEQGKLLLTMYLEQILGRNVDLCRTSFKNSKLCHLDE